MSKPEKTTTAAAAEKTPLALAVEAAPVAVRALSPIIVARWSEAQFKQARHAITPEAGTPFEHLTNPAYYAHIAPKVNAGDVIEVRPADNAYYAEIYVWTKGASWLQVSLLKRLDPPQAKPVPADTKGFSIEFVDGAAKHRVVRDSDRAELARGFDSPAAANAWLKANRGQLAA